MTIRDYFGNSLGVNHYYRHPRNYNRRGIFSIDEPSPTVRGVNRPLPKGYKGHSADSAPISNDIRPLTTLERSYIQTFPKNFQWSGTKTALEQLIGNAVPVKLAEFVGNCLQEYIRDKNNDNARLKPRQLTLDSKIKEVKELQSVI
jgi:DNA (cytosine-5)-methyltransferase 1